MKIFIKAKEGMRVKDPKTLLVVPEKGLRVDENSYWLRRLKDGSCFRVEETIKFVEKKEPIKKNPKGDK